MQALFNLIFDNFILFFIIGAGYFIYRQYKDLKDRTIQMNEIFIKTLNNYLEKKFNEVKTLAQSIKDEYGHIDRMAAEIDRLLFVIEKVSTGEINDLVEASNAINKYKVDKKIDAKRYPRMLELNDIGIFDEEDMESLDNGIAIARKEYNAQAFRYNEKASSFPIQYLTKYFKINSQYKIFDAPKSSTYEVDYEVFEEKEPEINSLTMLNFSKEPEPEITDPLEELDEDIDFDDSLLKPSKKIEEKED